MAKTYIGYSIFVVDALANRGRLRLLYYTYREIEREKKNFSQYLITYAIFSFPGKTTTTTTKDSMKLLCMLLVMVNVIDYTD